MGMAWGRSINRRMNRGHGHGFGRCTDRKGGASIGEGAGVEAFDVKIIRSYDRVNHPLCLDVDTVPLFSPANRRKALSCRGAHLAGMPLCKDRVG